MCVLWIDRSRNLLAFLNSRARPRVKISLATPPSGPVGHAWVVGLRARTALETALERLAAEIRDGRRGWATGIRQDGTTVTLPVSSGAASLLGTADRQSLRLMIVGGDGWTFVMHPLMGVAMLDEDPPAPNEQASEVRKPSRGPRDRLWVKTLKGAAHILNLEDQAMQVTGLINARACRRGAGPPNAECATLVRCPFRPQWISRSPHR